ncbi:hypothetical protein V1515DRAFT_589448, partial [Lipomyces mesembrius]
MMDEVYQQPEGVGGAKGDYRETGRQRGFADPAPRTASPHSACRLPIVPTTDRFTFAQTAQRCGTIPQAQCAGAISAVADRGTASSAPPGGVSLDWVLSWEGEGGLNRKKGCEYKFHTEFQSHEPEFDYLKSLEIEEKINKIKWCPRTNAAHFLLSTNDKTIKLWKIYEKSLKVVAEDNLSDTVGGRPPNPISIENLRLPRMTLHDTIIAASPKKIYGNAHAYHINSISSTRTARRISDQSFNIVDIKPANMEELTEVMTAAEFHPTSCNYFMYSSSKGTIKLADMRESALCDAHAKLFEEEEDPRERSFFSETISSISDVRFSFD